MAQCSASKDGTLPIVIIGAGISGLLLAQELRRSGIPFRIFERDNDFLTRGAGWGLTLAWCLPALRELLPDDLIDQLRDTYVDRAAVVERGESSAFPFFDLSTGEKKGATPGLPEEARIRVTREKLRRLLATNIEIQWGKTFAKFREESDSVHAIFEDGSTCQGRLIVGCDGSHSRVRRALNPQSSHNYSLPVRMFGFTLRLTAEQAKPILSHDPFFFNGTSSATNVFMFVSLLEAPQTPSSIEDGYLYQVCISWNRNQGPRDIKEQTALPTTQEERIGIVKMLSQDWAEPFKTFVQQIPDTTQVQEVILDDFLPAKDIQSPSKVLLIGDAYHAMVMYRGEGANHAIVDVLDFKQKVLPYLDSADEGTMASSIRNFEEGMIARTRPAVLASRRACLDAHEWKRLTQDSPLLMRRQMQLDFDDED